jgi:hypothetical protein
MTSTYNSPGLSAHEFLLSIVHDPSLDLYTRMDAAGKLMTAGLGDVGTVTTITINIEGGIPAPGTALGQDRPPGVVSAAGQAPDHRPPRRHRGFYLVKSG